MYATARRPESLEGFSQTNIHQLTLDVTDDESVKAAVQTIIDEEGQIDILVNNAGVSNSCEHHTILRSRARVRCC